MTRARRTPRADAEMHADARANRRDLAFLIRPLAQAQHHRRRAAIRSRFALGSLAILILTAALALVAGERPLVAGTLLACGTAIVSFQLGRLARMPEPVPSGWLMLAIESDLSPQGREALTPLLMADTVSCDTAFAWAREEAARPLAHAAGAADARVRS